MPVNKNKKPVVKETKEMRKKRTHTTSKNKAEKLQKFFIALQNGHHRKSAAVIANIPESTMNTWIAKDEEFVAKIREAEEFRLGVVHEKYRDLIKAGHRGAIEKELKSKRREIYGDKVTHDGEIGTGLDEETKAKIDKLMDSLE